MAGNTCDVCGLTGTAFVAASRLGPVSYAYCEQCLTAGYEPYAALVGGLEFAYHDGAFHVEDVHPALHYTLHASLSKVGKTLEQLGADCARLQRDLYEDYLRGVGDDECC